MWQRKTAILLTIGIICAILGLILKNYQFVTLSAFLLAPLAIAYLTLRNDVRIARVIHEQKIFEEDKLHVRLEITNTSGGTYLEIYDKVPSEMRVVEGTNRLILPAKHGETVTLEYVLDCPLRGYYLLGPTLVRTYDYLGLFSETKTVNVRTHLAVYPRIEQALEPGLTSRLHKVHLGAVALRQPGHGTEFHNIRDYNPYDPFKLINWKVTARKRKLMVNQKETEDICDAYILLDARAGTDAGTTLRNTLELGVKAALALADYLMKRANRVGLVTYNDKINMLRPSRGPRQLELILSTLTGTYARGNETFKNAIKQVQPYLTPRSPIILISNLEYDPTIRETVKFLLAGDFRFSILCPSSVDLEHDATRRTSPKYLMIKLERENYLNELRSYGVKVVDWTPDLPLAAVIQEVGY